MQHDPHALAHSLLIFPFISHIIYYLLSPLSLFIYCPPFSLCLSFSLSLSFLSIDLSTFLFLTDETNQSSETRIFSPSPPPPPLTPTHIFYLLPFPSLSLHKILTEPLVIYARSGRYQGQRERDRPMLRPGEVCLLGCTKTSSGGGGGRGGRGPSWVSPPPVIQEEAA